MYASEGRRIRENEEANRYSPEKALAILHMWLSLHVMYVGVCVCQSAWVYVYLYAVVAILRHPFFFFRPQVCLYARTGLPVCHGFVNQ